MIRTERHHHRTRGRQGGFGLVELMIAVAIVGVLASVAVPAYTRHLRTSQTVEVVASMAKIAMGAKAFFAASGALPPTSLWAPTTGHRKACRRSGGVFTEADLASFDAEPWSSLMFRPENKIFRYRYRWRRVRKSTHRRGARAFVEATSDLDCDRLVARWRLILQQGEDRTLGATAPFVAAGDPAE